MQLMFEVCSAGHGGSVPPLRKTFDGVGGVIGRGAGCDWSIADSSRLLSSHHALVSYRDGRYFLTDISSNGIGLGGSAERLRKGQARAISDGEVFLLGPLEVRARLMQPAMVAGHSAGALMTDGQIPDDAFLELDPLRGLALEQLRKEELAAWEGPPAEPGQWADFATADRDHLVPPELVKPAQEMTPNPQVGMSAQDDESFWSAFAEALGIRLGPLDSPGRHAVAIKAASLLRLTVDGLQQSLRTRTDLKNELELALTCTSLKGQNPLKDSADACGALELLLGDGQLGQVSAELAIVSAYRDLQAHQVAVLVACRAAVRGTLAAFAPAHLLLCFERQEKPPRFSTCGAHWRAYQRHYQRLIEDERLSERLLGADFAKAYEEQVRLISTLHSAYPG
jgi:type VI secretion system protein ImpI